MFHRRSIRPLLAGLACLGFLSSCREKPETFAIHSPIYPTGSQQVTYTLSLIEGAAEKVELFETVFNVSATGGLSGSNPESLIKTWDDPTFPLNFTRSGGYGTNKYVRYRFRVVGADKTYNHSIAFATSPYPVANAAIPVYVVGDVDRVLNCVFVRDSDLTNSLFLTHVGRNIDSSFHREEWIRRFRSSYNFYVNPHAGKASDFDTPDPHIYPSNNANLSFAQARIILHSASIRDWSDGTYVGTEYYNRGTILHETGHSLYGMADEYGGGSHWENDENPNNWDSKSQAEGAASGVGKTTADVVKMGSDNWWKLCNGDCMMLRTGLTIFPYDQPCRNRIFQRLVDRSSDNW